MHSADKLIEQVVRGEDPVKLVEDNEWALQFTDTSKSEEEANQQLKALKLQDGYIGGRVLPPSASKPGWRVQAFFIDEPEAKGVLPDGMRRVILPPGQKKALGIGESLTEGATYNLSAADLHSLLNTDITVIGHGDSSALRELGFVNTDMNGNSHFTRKAKIAAALTVDELAQAIQTVKTIKKGYGPGTMDEGGEMVSLLQDIGWISRGGTYNRLYVNKQGKAAIQNL